jgi:hypothetical protein
LPSVLFAEEDKHKPVSVMFWYQLIQWVGALADYAEKVGETPASADRPPLSQEFETCARPVFRRTLFLILTQPRSHRVV